MFACSALFPPCPDHTAGRFRSDSDGREALPRNAEFHIPANAKRGPVEDKELDEEAKEVCKATLEFMISLSEAKPAMVCRTDGWVSTIVRGCLGGIGELWDDEPASWLDADVRVLKLL